MHATFFRVEFDESYAYCATVYYSPKTGYRIEYWGQRNDFERISTGCARACYKDQKTSTGLSFLEIETQSGYKDQHQAFSAGILEGSLTWMSIYAQWQNTIQSFCEKNDENRDFCDWLRDVIQVNYKNVQKLARDQHKNEHYHHQVFLYYQQLLGIESGFKKGVKRARRDYEIPFVDFLLLNSRVDVEDLKIYYNNFVADSDSEKMEVKPRVGKMVLKIMMQENEQPKILIGHSADGDYNSMLKTVKTYRFNYHHGPEASRIVTNTDITFTSYPGSIASSDDFYLAFGKHSRVIVAGLSLKHHNSAQLMYGIDLEGTIFSSARVMAATRLSHNGKFWSRMMSRDPDLGAKQWLVIDEKRMKYLMVNDTPGDASESVTSSTTTELPVDENFMTSNEIPFDLLPSADLVRTTSNNNLIWMVDQTWRRLHAEDVTKQFKSDANGWLLDGSPTFKVIQELNGLQPKDIKVKSRLEKADDVVQYLKRKAYRGDLMEEPTTFGNIDLKVYTSEDRQLLVQNGPVVTDSTHPFNWSSDEFTDVRHDEHPTLWNFSPHTVQFIWS